VVRELFEIYLSDPGTLPEGWRRASADCPDETARARLISDYIAGMTDRYAIQEHRQLTDPATRV
jgi:dGTPase